MILGHKVQSDLCFLFDYYGYCPECVRRHLCGNGRRLLGAKRGFLEIEQFGRKLLWDLTTLTRW